MCDYSLMHVKSRAAKKNDRLRTSSFLGTNSKGFAGADREEMHTAICVLPGTELAFDMPVACGLTDGPFTCAEPRIIEQTTARFRQINLEHTHMHHDALEFPDGEIVLLNLLKAGQLCTVLQLPAKPKNKAEAQEQKRLEVVA